MRNLPTPPVAKKKAKVLQYHNQEFHDDYYWLRERENEDVIAYLEEENKYTNEIMASSKSVEDEIFEEIKARVKEEDQSVPVFEDGYYYYTRNEEGKQYKIHCRKKDSLDAEEEIILDENLLAKGEDYFSLGEFTISPNNELLAYSIDTDGSEMYEVFVLHLPSRTHYANTIPDTYYGLEWANDNRHLFYTKLDHAHRPYQLWMHHIEKPVDQDSLKYEEVDESFFIDVSKTKDQHYILLSLNSQVTSEVHFLDAEKVNEQFQCITKREYGVEYDVDHYQGYFHLLSNINGAKNFQWFKAPIGTSTHEQWEEVLAYNPAHFLLELEFFEKYVVLEERFEGAKQIRIFDSEIKNEYVLAFDEEAHTVSLGDNPEFQSETLRIHYRSMVTPNTVFDYDIKNKTLLERKVQIIPSGYDKSHYESRRIMVEARDGEKIPVSLVYRKDLDRTKPHPMYLYAYGSYGVNVDPYFSIAQLSLLNRGFMYAIAHIRGGSDKGRDWYEKGKFLQKKNTFFDFIDVAQYFVDQSFTSPELLVANGGSAGGLLMGAVSNLRPDLFHTIVADVPFVDVIHTMMDETIPLTVIEYDEWGNPNEKEYFDYMLSYAPYNNVEKKDYPNLLVTAGLNDPRVQYWEPAKWVAKLREYKTDDHLLLLKTNMDAGHGGKSGRFERIRETAFEFAFILKTLGRNS